MSGAYVVTSYRILVAGERVIHPYVELERRYYRWTWLARLMRGPRGGAAKVGDGKWAFWRSDIVEAERP